ncbi:flagellar basal-body rod protein FlgF [Zooshikella ganghwensis]|uniref:Flagellar basal-body rod protein FlgF n=1 Tax=Zooshikella ganghwensis TaxID=202772 RepID=A0A4P9VJ52_9GAMM|nr:flagellar basal-body rod protein FlgF [Zooshikella ganghwensis]RDH43243.1 flagellar basal-body rod protein FlgF [Zooshikella ganghwensis]
MDKALYVSMTGAVQNMLGQRIHANNLANITTTGFRRDFEQARSMPVFGEFYPSRAYAMTENPGQSFDQGPLMETGNDLDVAIGGDGWIAVQGADGEERYTRAGNLTIGTNGELFTGSGLPVLGENGPIVIPEFEKIELGLDGTISIRPVGQPPNELAEVNRIKLVNPDVSQLIKGTDGLFKFKENEVAPADANVRLVPGFLEGSNVNGVAEMISLLALTRQYEVNVKMMRSLEENSESMESVLRIN